MHIILFTPCDSLLWWLFQDQDQSAAGGKHGPQGGPKHTAKQIVQAFYEAYNAADVDGVMELMAENAGETFRARGTCLRAAAALDICHLTSYAVPCC